MKNFLLFFLFLNTALFSQKYSKEEHQALNDSVKLIRGIQPLKAINMLLEIADTQKDFPTPQLTNTYNIIAEILFKQGLFSESLSYFKLSLDCFALTRNNFPSTNVTYPPWILINIGNVYFHNKNFEKAYEYFQMAQENFQETNEHNKLYGLPTAYDNIGKVFLEKGSRDSALIYFQKSLKIREENKLKGAMIYSYNNLMSLVPPDNEYLALKYEKIVDGLFNQISFLPNQPDGQINIETNYGIFNYKLGQFYYDLNEFEKSINYLIKSSEFLSNSFNDKINSELLMAKCKIALKNYKQAETILIKNLNYLRKIGVNSPLLKVRIYNLLNKVYSDLSMKDQLILVKDSIINLNTNISNNKLSNSILSLETSLLLDEKQRELNDELINYYYLVFGLVTAMILFVILIVSLRLNINFQKEKNKRLAIQKELINTELKNKQLELIGTTSYIEQRNSYLENLRDSLKNKSISGQSPDFESKVSNLNSDLTKELDQIIGSRNSFESFNNQFNKAFPDFFKNLISLHPDLSQTDLQLCAYIKLNQSNQDIARIKNLSLRSVESQRYRLRKKLKIEKTQDLFNYLTNID